MWYPILTLEFVCKGEVYKSLTNRNSFINIFSKTKRRRSFSRGWYNFSRNPLSVVGMIILLLIIFAAIFAPYITPFPEHAGAFTNFREASKPPSSTYIFGTDSIGRDIFTRVIFGYRFSLILSIVVLALSIPPGVIFGLIAGYYQGTWIEIIIMRITDVFIAVPPFVLALAVAAMLSPNLFNQMMAISFVWWTWYCRLVYTMTTSLCHEDFVTEAKLVGASKTHILFREILPNCMGPILTKMTLDMGLVIIVGSSLSFIGLGVQPPKSDLGTMIAEGARRLPSEWWAAVFPAIAIIVVILAFNLLGDGLKDVFNIEEV
ncbi:MAG: Binding-protein-dependent transport systems inner membrane component [Atribacteria bacterium 34_128]|nr:MAG: Binding-protein-dependent transport systems inner membrane component [Atribacteria bacterium 34_128]